MDKKPLVVRSKEVIAIEGRGAAFVSQRSFPVGRI